MDLNREWTHLNEAQADGRACVMCEMPTGSRPGGSVPVGRSSTGSQVFACAGICAEQAEMTVPEPGSLP